MRQLFLFLSCIVFASEEMQFLKINPSARADGVGEAITAMSYGLNDIWSNPASLGWVKNMEFIGGYSKWFIDMGHINYGLAFRPKNSSNVFSLVANGFDYGDFENRNIDGELEGTFGGQTYAIALSYARGIVEKEKEEEGEEYKEPEDYRKFFKYGITVKYVYEKIEEDIASGYCIDGGIIYAPVGYYPYRVGVAITNLGPGLTNRTSTLQTRKIYPSPAKLRLGGAYLWEASPMATINVELDGIISLTGSYSGIAFGTEVVINNMFFIRAGTKYSIGQYSYSPDFGLGIGIKLADFTLDYAYNIRYLQNTQRVSISIAF